MIFIMLCNYFAETEAVIQEMQLSVYALLFVNSAYCASLDLVFYLRYQFVPQLIFLNSLFGYLSLLIVVKWCTGSQADLYHVMIYMFLSPTDDLGENQLFPGQKLTQVCRYPPILYCFGHTSGK